MTADYVVFAVALAVIASGVIAAVVWQLRKIAAVAPFRRPRPRQDEAVRIVWHDIFGAPKKLQPPPIHWITGPDITGMWTGTVVYLVAPEGIPYSHIPFAHELRHAYYQRMSVDMFGDVSHTRPGWDAVERANAALEAAGL